MYLSKTAIFRRIILREITGEIPNRTDGPPSGPKWSPCFRSGHRHGAFPRLRVCVGVAGEVVPGADTPALPPPPVLRWSDVGWFGGSAGMMEPLGRAAAWLWRAGSVESEGGGGRDGVCDVALMGGEGRLCWGWKTGSKARQGCAGLGCVALVSLSGLSLSLSLSLSVSVCMCDVIRAMT